MPGIGRTRAAAMAVKCIPQMASVNRIAAGQGCECALRRTRIRRTWIARIETAIPMTIEAITSVRSQTKRPARFTAAIPR